MIKRPKRGENEEDLLKFQEEFLKNKNNNASATVSRRDKRKSDSNDQRDVVQLESLPSTIPGEPTIPVKKSKFRKTREEATAHEEDSLVDAEEKLEKHDRHMAQVLTHIIERDTRNAAVFLPRQTTQAFPTALHRGQMEQTASGNPDKKRKSLFAQHLAVSGAKDFGVVLQQEIQKAGEVSGTPNTDTAHTGAGDKSSTSRIIQGSGLSATLGCDEARKIHEENLEKISEMSESEILAERRKLLEMMDPKLVEFLTSKKNADAEAMDTESGPTTSEKQYTKNKNKGKVPGFTDSAIPVQPDSKWVHMDKVEYDKLEWMKDLPPPKSGDTKSGVAARFDFHGNLVPADADTPVYEGLHHHGQEPERAGYSLEELFQLARSSNIQQRTLALQVLARVINKAKCGGYIGLIQTPILPSILESGVIFLFRWALDDTIDTVLSAAVAAMHALICNPGDQNCLDIVSSWFQGHVLPGQCPISMVTDRKDGDETVEETDAEIANRDVILGLVTRMVFLQRLRHILETRRPQAVTVVQVLDMLTKIAQHSPGMAYEIIHCPRLLDLVFKNFLPTAWEPLDPQAQLSNVYGYPLTAALRLVGALCQAGRNMASHLISKYKLQNILLRYMAVKSSELQLQAEEAELLQCGSFRVWRICLSYGLATQTYIDLYSTLVRYIQSSQQRLQFPAEHPSGQQIEAAVFSCCETVVNVAGSSKSTAGFIKSQDGCALETEPSEEVISPGVNWSHVAGLAQPITNCVQCMLEDIQQNYQFKKRDLHMETSCINFLASFYTKLEKQASYNPVECLQSMEHFCDNYLLPCWKSIGFKSILQRLSSHSNLLSPPETVSVEVAPSIIDLQASHTECSFVVPVLKSPSPYGFITAVLRLIHVMCKLHKGIIDKVLPEVTQDEDLVSYMKKISQNKPSCLAHNYFTRYENYLQYFFLKLVTLKPSSVSNMSVFHRCGLHLLARLQEGDEHLAHDLLSVLIFNQDFIPEGKEEELACAHLQDMNLSDTSKLMSATQQEINAGRTQLLRDVYTRLPSIRSTYITAFASHQRTVTVSRNRFLQNTMDTESLMTRSTGEMVLPRDWMYLPLIELYSRASVPGSRLQNNVPPHLVAMASNVLYWVFVLECWRSHILGAVSITLKISRVMCTFMAGNDLFLDRSVSCLLVALLREYTKPASLERMDFSEEIPGLSSFYDLFGELLQQFESVSFGDSVFACYVLVALQRKHSVQMRRLVWGEKAGVLRIFRVPLSEVLVPIHQFLNPDESDLPLLQLYFQCLLSQSVRPTWSPIMYLTAVHHVTRFLYYQADQDNQAVRETMWATILRSKLKDVQHHLLYYKSADTEQALGMVFYTELPSNRQALVDRMRAVVMKNG